MAHIQSLTKSQKEKLAYALSKYGGLRIAMRETKLAERSLKKLADKGEALNTTVEQALPYIKTLPPVPANAA